MSALGWNELIIIADEDREPPPPVGDDPTVIQGFLPERAEWDRLVREYRKLKAKYETKVD